MSVRVIAGCLVSLGLVWSLSVSAQESANRVLAASSAALPLEDLRIFVEVLNKIKSTYVAPVTDQTLLENAIKGMLSNLDPHSAYLDAEEFADLQKHTSGSFTGIGIELSLEDGVVEIISAIDGTPAAQADIQSGDLLLEVDGHPTDDLSLMEVTNLLRGKSGSKVVLTLLRGERTLFDVTLIREAISMQSVKSSLLEEGYGYVRISEFQANTAKEMRAALTQLKKTNNQQKLSGLVLDVRNNPGGLVQAAVEVADLFLEKGLIVYTKGRTSEAEQRFFATRGDLSEAIPLVVLINEGTASASEILSGALQDHQRAIVMGTESFGKGSVQTVLPLINKRAIKLTTALYYTPNGHSIQALGITPDVAVEPVEIKARPVSKSYKEADLAGHLDNAQPAAEKAKAAKNKDRVPLQAEDYVLQQALNLLKGLHISRKRA